MFRWSPHPAVSSAELPASLALMQREMDTLFATILDDGHNLVGADKCSLFFVDEEKGELWTKVATDNHGAIKVRRIFWPNHVTPTGRSPLHSSCVGPVAAVS